MFVKFFCKYIPHTLYNSRQNWCEVDTYALKIKKYLVMSLDQLYQVSRMQILANKMSSELKLEILMQDFFLIGQWESDEV